MLFYSDLNQSDNLVDAKLYNLESIYQSIHNIISTEKGQRDCDSPGCFQFDAG